MENIDLNNAEKSVTVEKEELVKAFKFCQDQFYELPYANEVSIDQQDNISAIGWEINEVQNALKELTDNTSRSQLLALRDKINTIKARFNAYQKSEGKEDLFTIE